MLLSSDFVLICLAFLSSIGLRYEFTFPKHVISLINYESFAFFIFIKFSCFKIFGLYRGMWRYTSIWDMLNIIKANLVASAVIIIYVLINQTFFGISRSIFILDFSISVVFIGSSRLGIRMFFTQILNVIKTDGNEPDGSIKKVILIGAGDTGQSILRQILQNTVVFIN